MNVVSLFVCAIAAGVKLPGARPIPEGYLVIDSWLSTPIFSKPAEYGLSGYSPRKNRRMPN